MSTPITDLPLDQELIEKILALSIDSIEALFSLFTALEDRPELLSDALVMDAEALAKLKETIKRCLPDETVESLSVRPNAEAMPLGAFLTEESVENPAPGEATQPPAPETRKPNTDTSTGTDQGISGVTSQVSEEAKPEAQPEAFIETETHQETPPTEDE